MRKYILILLGVPLCSWLSASEQILPHQKMKANDYYEQAVWLAQEGDIEASRAKCKIAFQLDPANEEIRHLLHSYPSESSHRIKLEKKEMSREYYRKALYTFLEGDNKNAKRLWRKALKCDPENLQAQKALKMLAIREREEKLTESGASDARTNTQPQ